MKVEMSPYIFGRIGGTSFGTLQSIEAPEMETMSQALSDERSYLNQIKNKINHVLYSKIKEAREPKLQNFLLSLKRDVHNDRDIRYFIGRDLLANDSELKAILHENISSHERVSVVKTTIEKAYDEAIIGSVQQLKRISDHYFLKNGLIFSTSCLYHDLKNFLPAARQGRSKKDERIALSLLKYLTRSAAKTSPFSSFNSIFALRQEENIFEPIRIFGNSSHVHFNNLVYLLFKQVLLSQPSTRSFFRIDLNPTLQNTCDGFQYFHNHDNNEGFYVACKSEILVHVIEFLRTQPDVTYGTLSHEIQKVAGAESKAANAYLDQLLDKGIVIIQFPVWIKDKTWPEQLLSLLESFVPVQGGEDIAARLASILDRLLFERALLINNYNTDKRQKVTLQARIGLVSGIRELVEISQEVENTLSALHADNLFYEDTMTESVDEIDCKVFQKAFTKMASLNAMLQRCSYKNEIRKEFSSKLKTRYGDSRVPLLEFYRDVYIPDNTVDKLLVSYQSAIYNTFQKFFQALPPQISGSALDLESFLENESINEFSTLDLFAQIGKFEGERTLVVNGILSGATTNISRFIDLFPAYNIARSIKKKLCYKYKNMILAELVDGSIHNTNTFSVLTDFIIDVSLNASGSQQKINLHDLFISLDKTNHVKIENGVGTRVMPMDFSMESIQRRSALMKFIDLFNHCNSEGLTSLLRLYEEIIISKSSSDDAAVIIIPRLYYSKRIVLARKKWLIQKRDLNNLFSKKTSDALQFVAFNEWRRKLQIPDHIFVCPRENPGNKSHEKPQYINLRAPLLFALFKNSLLKLNNDQIIEVSEMLPAPEHLANVNQEPYVMEYIFSLIRTN